MPTAIRKEPKIAHNAREIVTRLNPRYHFPTDMEKLEKQIRISLGMPYQSRGGGQLPYGYLYNEIKDTCEPIPECFELLWQARRYLVSSSLLEVATWIKYKTDKLNLPYSLSHYGLAQIMCNRPPYEECFLPMEEKEKILASLTAWNKTHPIT